MYVRDLNGNEYPLEATVTHDFELNGKPVLSFVAKSSRVNDVFLEEFDAMWQVIDFDDVVHRIEYARKRGEGERLQVDVKATPSFYDDFAVSRIYTRYDEHMTAAEAFTLIFADTDYSFVLVDAFAAVQWAGFGDGDTRLETFKRALERYNAEFRISGNTIYLEQQIGEDTSFMYRYRLNASNIQQEVDASNYWTYMRGYGDFAEGEEENALLFREYSSPLAAIIGKRDAPPYYNGSISTVERMDEVLRETVDNSLKVSVSTDVIDLRKQGYPLAQPNLGDRVYLTDERIGFDEEVRIYQMTIVRDWKGDVLDLKLVIGSPTLVKRHQAQLSNAVDRIEELANGKLPIPLNSLPEMVRVYSEALKSVLTELIFDNGIIAVDKNDPNKLVLLNSAGLGISEDGGNNFKTAITGDGIVADAMTLGTLRGILIEAVDIIGSRFYSEQDPLNYTLIEGPLVESRGRFTRTFRGVETTHDIKTKLEHGFVRFRNDTLTRSLYMSEFGISTFLDGTGEYLELPGGASGSLIFWDQMYSPSNANGVTLNSYGGVVALRSDVNQVVIDSKLSTDIYSRESVVYITPKSDLEGNSNFWFNRINSTNDGFLMFGSRDTTANVGLRMSKSGNTISIVDGDYTRGGNTRLDVGNVETNRIIPREASSDLFLGTRNGGYVRVTNSAGYNNGNGITYEGIAAKEFAVVSSRDQKKNIEDFSGSGLDLVNGTKVRSYHFNNEIDDVDIKHVGLIVQEAPLEIINMKTGDAIDTYAMLSVLWKAVQELDAKESDLRMEFEAYKQETNETIAALVARVEALEAR